MKPTLKILFCPVHYFFTRTYGSEPAIAYEIFTRISNRLPNSKGVIFYDVDSEKKYNKRILYSSVKEKPYYVSLKESLLFVYYYTIQGFKIIRNENYMILHHLFPFRLGRSFNLLFILLGSNTKKVIGPLQVPVDIENKNPKKDIKSVLLGIIEKFFMFFCLWTLKKADIIITMNEEAKKAIVKCGINSQKIMTIPIGIDIAKFTYKSLKSKEKDRLELLVVAYLVKRKCVELVIKGFSELAKQNSNIYLRVIGDGPEIDMLKKLTLKLKLEKKVIFDGFIPYESIVDSYQRAHILVSMSRFESWGQVYVDAMACGLPIVTSDNIGSKEIIKDGKYGFLIEQENIKLFVQKVQYLIDNPKVLEKFGYNARKEIEERYDWERVIVPQYLSIYKKLAE